MLPTTKFKIVSYERLDRRRRLLQSLECKHSAVDVIVYYSNEIYDSNYVNCFISIMVLVFILTSISEVQQRFNAFLRYKVAEFESFVFYIVIGLRNVM